MRLPKATPEQAAARAAALERAYQEAANVPLGTTSLSVEAIELAREVASRGNKASVSDAGVAALAGRCAAEGAALNVLINLGSITDEAYKTRARSQVETLVARARALADETLALVNASMTDKAGWI
jgi:formiminotetrahydrofolate cyclodeaminase